VLTPPIAAELHIRSLHELARAQGQAEVRNVREELGKLAPTEWREWVATRWALKLGGIEPNRSPQAKVAWTKEMPSANVEAIALTVEPGIIVPMLLMQPLSRAKAHLPVVVAVAEGGKDLFLAERSEQIEELLKGGVAVCLPDVRGTGETLPNPTPDPDGDAIREHNAGMALMLGETLLGERVKDLRTVLTYLESRQDLDRHRIGLWGDSFEPPNPSRLLIDELPQWHIGPQIEEQAEPLGGLLAVLGGLYEDNVRAVAVQGGLASYLSVLDDYFAYVPADVIVSGILEAGDIADVVAALAPRPVLLAGLVDGRDRMVPVTDLRSKLAPVYESYRKVSSAALSIRTGENASHFADWFLTHL
jgi:hypothetical protein